MCNIKKHCNVNIFQRKKIVGQNIAFIRKVVQWIERNVKIPLDNFEKKCMNRIYLLKHQKQIMYLTDSINSEHC